MKILVLKNRAMGDAVMGLSSLQYLSHLYPGAEIHYYLPAWILPLFEKVDFGANIKIFPWPAGFWANFKRIRTERYDLLIELHQRASSAKILNLCSWFLRIPYIFHNHHLKKGKVIHQGETRPAIQRDLDGVWSGLKRVMSWEGDLPSYLDFAPQMKVEAAVRPRVVLGVVASRSTKMWPLSYFKELIELLRKEIIDLEFIIPISHSAMDQEVKQQLDLWGIPTVQLSLDQLPQLMRTAKLYIGNDTGLKHIAVAVGTRTFTFFGPEDPLEWHPYDREKHLVFYNENMPCRTRTAHFCGLNTCEEHLCLESLSALEVAQKALPFLS